MAAFLAVAAVAAPAAQAVDPPLLTDSIPKSPGTSTTPKIVGIAGGGITRKGLQSITAGGGDVTTIVDIYTTSDCSGTPVAIGNAAELEGGGIQVTVAEDTTTSFYATQTESTITSACSTQPFKYRQVSDAPGAPTFSSVNPASPANNNNPRLKGVSDPGSTVQIFTNATCSGVPYATGTAAQFGGNGIQVLVTNNTTTTFHARATIAGLLSPCSTDSITYREDSTAPPSPQLSTRPGPRANNRTPLVLGSAPGASSVQIYRDPDCAGSPMATGSANDLQSGIKVTVADNQTTSFYGMSFDVAGTASPCSPTPAVYTADSIPPKTRITLAPGVKTRRRAPVFRFKDVTVEPGTRFLCKLDRRKWKSCRAPARYHRLRFGKHVFRVRAIDAAGNHEKAGARRRFKLIH